LTERHYKLLKLLEDNPGLSQRELARELDISLGSTNYALRALVSRGWVKAQNFRRSDNKKAYLYKLTPSGIAEKTRLAYHFLQSKRVEHERLMQEIEQLRAEVEATPGEDQ
jgi:EPS-associated MarR family transcriptional regulator